MQSRRLVDIFVMRADYCVVVNLVSTGALGPSLPNCFSAGWLLHIQAEPDPLNCRTLHFSLFNSLHELSLGIFLQTFEGPLNGGTTLWCTEVHMLPCKISCYSCHWASFSLPNSSASLSSCFPVTPLVSTSLIFRSSPCQRAFSISSPTGCCLYCAILNPTAPAPLELRTWLLLGTVISTRNYAHTCAYRCFRNEDKENNAVSAPGHMLEIVSIALLELFSLCGSQILIEALEFCF